MVQNCRIFSSEWCKAMDKKGAQNWKKYLNIEGFPEFQPLESEQFKAPFKIKNKPQAYPHRAGQLLKKVMGTRLFMFRAPSLGVLKPR